MGENPVAVPLNLEASCKLFVGNVNKNTTDEEFDSYFRKYGSMKEITLMREINNPTLNRGFGFVTPLDVEVTDAILLASPHNLGGRELDIKRALPKDIEDPLLHVKTTRIFLGGLPHNITEEELCQFFDTKFGSLGVVKEVVIKKDRITSKPRGFCFISFSNHHVVDKIMVEERFPIINSKRCEVKKADPGVPITGAPPSQWSKYSSTPPQSYRPTRYHRPPAPQNAYDYNNYNSNPSMMAYPQTNAYYSYYQNHSNNYPPNPYGPQNTPTSNYGGVHKYPENNTRPPYSRPYHPQNDRTRPY